MCHWELELVADDENADAARVRIGLQRALDLGCRELGEVGAEDDDVGSRLGGFAQGGGAVRGFGNVEARAHQCIREDESCPGIVVSDQRVHHCELDYPMVRVVVATARAHRAFERVHVHSAQRRPIGGPRARWVGKGPRAAVGLHPTVAKRVWERLVQPAQNLLTLT